MTTSYTKDKKLKTLFHIKLLENKSIVKYRIYIMPLGESHKMLVNPTSLLHISLQQQSAIFSNGIVCPQKGNTDTTEPEGRTLGKEQESG